jgi:hypothetical protein
MNTKINSSKIVLLIFGILLIGYIFETIRDESDWLIPDVKIKDAIQAKYELGTPNTVYARHELLDDNLIYELQLIECTNGKGEYILTTEYGEENCTKRNNTCLNIGYEGRVPTFLSSRALYWYEEALKNGLNQREKKAAEIAVKTLQEAGYSSSKRKSDITTASKLKNKISPAVRIVLLYASVFIVVCIVGFILYKVLKKTNIHLSPLRFVYRKILHRSVL